MNRKEAIEVVAFNSSVTIQELGDITKKRYKLYKEWEEERELAKPPDGFINRHILTLLTEEE